MLKASEALPTTSNGYFSVDWCRHNKNGMYTRKKASKIIIIYTEILMGYEDITQAS